MQTKQPQGFIATDKAPTDLLMWFPKGDIQHIESLLNQRFDMNPAALQEQLLDLSAWQGRCLGLLADADSLLDFAEQKAIMKRDDEWTDLDRRVNLKAATRNERRARDILKGFADAFKNKLILGMSLRKSLLGEVLNTQEG